MACKRIPLTGFARGVDFELAPQAIERATQLILEIAGGQPGPVIEVQMRNICLSRRLLLLRRQQIVRLLGIELPMQIWEILQSIGTTVTAVVEGWQVQVPSYRYDLTIEVDLIEELGRLHGYQRIPLQTAWVPMQALPHPENQIPQPRLVNFIGRSRIL